MIELDDKLRNVTLDEKYTLDSGTVLINGAQCLARLPLLQRQLDFKSGLNTAGFISGYRGSPIGNLDQTLWHIGEKLKANNIVFQPGVNEDLAATAIAGSQQISSVPDPRDQPAARLLEPQDRCSTGRLRLQGRDTTHRSA